MPLLDVENLTVTLQTAHGPARAVRDLSFTLERGQTLGIVGESGCGKSMTALAVMGLLPENGIATGAVRLEGTNLLDLGERQMCDVRGNRLAMVFQEPMTSLNPLHTVGRQIGEALRLHRGLAPGRARSESLRLLEQVGIPEPARRLDTFPHQLSGGQRQRVMITMALSCNPDVLIADEPTTALDVTIQKQILELIAQLVEDLDMGLILISHDLGVIAETVNRVMVMYGGACVEEGDTAQVFRGIAHPYTQGLFSAVPQIDYRPRRLMTIPGTVPDLIDLPTGCTFAGRCGLAIGPCRERLPEMQPAGTGHRVACIRADDARSQWDRGAT
ncbi:MAG TPA: ABC transporter ATP-binding protein [Alphaproteobacteria bacterium]|nr:ABC transporter ATP-binding protein [Alphaproteobacteria bacterium]